MKEIKAFIHQNRIADVLHELKENEFCSSGCNVSINHVDSLLQAIDNKEKNYSIELGMGIIDQIKLELICTDDLLEKAISIIKKNARTGQALAGYIYVSDIAQAIPIND